MIGTLWLRQCCITGSRRISTVSPKGAVEVLRRVVDGDELGAGDAVVDHGDGGHGLEAQALREAHDLVAELVTVLAPSAPTNSHRAASEFSAPPTPAEHPAPAGAPDKVYSFQGARRCRNHTGMFSTPSPSDTSHMTPTTPWSIRAWPPLLWQAGANRNCASTTWARASPCPATARSRTAGQTLWGGQSDDGEAGVAWDWVQISGDVVAMADPMSVVTNLRLRRRARARC